jgi:hypothetical protein
MKTSESVKQIAPALVAAQLKIKHAVKDAKNPHFKNDYATLESVIDATKDELLKQNIVVIQSVGTKILTTRLQHTSGEFIEEESELILVKNDMQGLGSSITYMRRFQLSAMLNLAQTDDDGNNAALKTKKLAVASKVPVTKKDTDPF